VLKECTKLENGVAKYWYQLGSVQHELLKIHESEMALKRVILIDPLHKKAHWRLAAVLEDQGNVCDHWTSARTMLDCGWCMQ
jgi:hypothetical protein